MLAVLQLFYCFCRPARWRNRASSWRCYSATKITYREGSLVIRSTTCMPGSATANWLQKVAQSLSVCRCAVTYNDEWSPLRGMRLAQRTVHHETTHRVAQCFSLANRRICDQFCECCCSEFDASFEIDLPVWDQQRPGPSVEEC